MRHINARGHQDVALIIGSLLRDTSCELARDPNYVVHASSDKHELVENLPHRLFHEQLEAAYGDDMATQEQALKIMEQGWAEEQRSFIATPRRPKKENEDDEDPPEPEPVFFPGMWNRPPEYGVAPRQYVLDGWNDNVETRVPPWHPHCYSTRAVEPKFNLTMKAANGFEWWVHQDFKDKPYVRGTKPGDSVTFEIETIVGTIKMYVLMSKTFGFGILQCQVSGKDEKVEIDTYWDKDPNIGRFATVAENLGPGRHTVKCEIMKETSDPEGRSEVRIISLMRWVVARGLGRGLVLTLPAFECRHSRLDGRCYALEGAVGRSCLYIFLVIRALSKHSMYRDDHGGVLLWQRRRAAVTERSGE